MQSDTRLAAVLLAGMLALAGWFAYDGWFGPAAERRGGASGVPVVMRTPGGLLEIATVTVHERFKREDTRHFWGIPLGTTVSIIQVPVVYRYHIPLAREWPIRIHGKTAVVHAAEVQPSLPPAIDTARMEKYTSNGWARFNKDENLQLLERSITPELGSRANDPAIRRLAIDAGRQTVREFVTTWLLKEQGWQRDSAYQVRVLFPGEQEPSRPGQPG